MKLTRLLSANRWPILLAGFLGMSVVAQGVLVWVATRPDAPRPIEHYYEKGLSWEADEAVLAASERLGWSARVEVPQGEEYALTLVRPVDVSIRDRDGAPVSALSGRLVAVRPADTRLNGESELVELPYAPGSYRTLAHLPAAGVWELNLDLRRGDEHYVHTERVEVLGDRAP